MGAPPVVGQRTACRLQAEMYGRASRRAAPARAAPAVPSSLRPRVDRRGCRAPPPLACRRRPQRSRAVARDLRATTNRGSRVGGAVARRRATAASPCEWGVRRAARRRHAERARASAARRRALRAATLRRSRAKRPGSEPSVLIAANELLLLANSCRRELFELQTASLPSSLRRACRGRDPQSAALRHRCAAAMRRKSFHPWNRPSPRRPGNPLRLAATQKSAPARQHAALAGHRARPTPQGPPGPRVRDRRRGGQNYAGAAARVLHQEGVNHLENCRTRGA